MNKNSTIFSLFMLLSTCPTNADVFKSIGHDISGAADKVAGVIKDIAKIHVINTSGKSIKTTYSNFLFQIPRVTQQDWFDATKTGIWDIKPEIAFSHSSKGSSGPLAMVTAYFPGDFYLRMDLMMEAAQAQSNDAAASASA